MPHELRSASGRKKMLVQYYYDCLTEEDNVVIEDADKQVVSSMSESLRRLAYISKQTFVKKSIFAPKIPSFKKIKILMVGLLIAPHKHQMQNQGKLGSHRSHVIYQ